jgi:transcriptional regulator with PAS, ATPase and Fis domain
MNYPFPGNVRELENILEHAYVLSKGPIIERRDLPREFLTKTERNTGTVSATTLVKSAEAQIIRDILRRHKGCRVSAARELGLSRSTLWRKIRKFHLE